MQICGTGADPFFEQYVYTGLIFMAAGLCLTRAIAVRRERTAWLVLGTGLLAWAGGEVYYSAFYADLAEPPLPGVSDGLWLTFYPACYVAIVLLVRERVRQFRTSLWLDGLVGALAACGNRGGAGVRRDRGSGAPGRNRRGRSLICAGRPAAPRLRRGRLRADRMAARPRAAAGRRRPSDQRRGRRLLPVRVRLGAVGRTRP